jgi:hypothetical protein
MSIITRNEAFLSMLEIYDAITRKMPVGNKLYGSLERLMLNCEASSALTVSIQPMKIWLMFPPAPSSRHSERDLPLLPSYRGGQLVVEYATVCFRSQEDFGPFA